ncbi:MAG: hypothetical protein QOH90_383, partial [Actinomycetota bacterium]|nr:hypothetical protein [Actinomycetota bacterium]
SLTIPGVAKWLIRLATVKRFDAIWLSSAIAAEENADPTPGLVTFTNTVELGEKALSDRFTGDELP